MYEVLNTNFAWVSPDGALKFCVDVSTLENWDFFTRGDLIKKYHTKTAENKVRSNLDFLVYLGLINEINDHNKIEEKIFFQLLREGKTKEAFEYLKNILENQPFFQKILNDFFFDKKTKSVKELREFIKSIDHNSHKPRQYHKGSNFFAKFMYELGLIEYQQRAQTVTAKYGKFSSQKKLIETPKISIQTKNGFQEILNEIIPYIKNIDNKKDLAKLINVMKEDDRIKITEKLLENQN